MAVPSELSLCQLCFADMRNVPGRQLDQDYLENVYSTTGIELRRPSPHISQLICTYCESQVDCVRVLRERINFTKTLWDRYIDRIQNGLAKTEKEPVQPDSINVQLNCHDCGVVLEYPDLLTHITLEHGAEHVEDCRFCAVLLGAKVTDEIIVEGAAGEEIEHIESQLELVKPELKNEEVSQIDQDKEPEEEEKEEGTKMDNDEAEGDDDYNPEENDELIPEDDDAFHPEEVDQPAEEHEKSATDSDGASDDSDDRPLSDLKLWKSASVKRDKAGRFCCGFCEKSYSRVDKLYQHMAQEHKHKDRPGRGKMPSLSTGFPCKWCGKCLSRQDKLEHHWLIHDKRPYHCAYCESKYAKKSELNQHQKEVHPGWKEEEAPGERDLSKPFQCQYCARSFSRRRHMVLHVRQTHTGVEGDEGDGTAMGFVCEECGKLYADRAKLDKHMLTHMATPFDCAHCDERFDSRTKATAHMILFHSKETAMGVEISSAAGESVRWRGGGRLSTAEANPFKCQHCPMAYKRREYLRAHVKKKHKDVAQDDDDAADNSQEGATMADPGYTCDVCGKSYSRIDKLDRHSFMHSETPFACEFCDEEFDSRKKRNAHVVLYHPDEMKRPAPEGPREMFSCQVCGKSFTRHRSRELHMETHDGQKYKCPLCDKEYTGRYSLNRHHMQVHAKKPYQCGVCEKYLSRQDKLDRHMRIHNGYKCKECDEIFDTARLLTAHNLIHDPNPQPPPPKPKKKQFECRECYTSYANEATLKRHVQNNHKEEGYPCKTCNKVLNTKIKLKVHEYSHKRKLCGICGLTISNSFSTHMRRHAGIKPFKCNVEDCPMEFARNCDLKAHIKTHTGEKNFPCDLCDMRFSRPYKVAQHRRIHTGEKPYKCKLCGHRFAQSFDLVLHLRRHTGEKPYECKGCGERFYLNSLLKKHSVNCRHVPADEPLAAMPADEPEATVVFDNSTYILEIK